MIVFAIGGWVASPQQPPIPAIDEVRSAGRLGFWGSILMFIPIINVIGALLVLLALHRLSKAYNNEAIWRNTRKTLLTIALGLIIIGVTISLIVSGFYYSSYMSSILIGFYVTLIVAIISGRYVSRAYKELTNSSGVKVFNKVAHYSWYGSILLVFLVGLLPLITANVYALWGFRKLKNLQ